MPGSRTHNLIPKSLFVMLHVGLYGLGLSIPMMLAVQSVWVDGQLSGERWAAVLGDLSRWGRLLLNTAVVAAVAVGVAVPAGCALALMAFKTVWSGRRGLIALLVLWACTPMYVTSGAVFNLVDVFTVQESRLLAGLIHGLACMPLAAILIGLGLRCVEPELEEAARLEYSSCGVLWHISLPRAAWSIAAAALIALWLVLTDNSVTDVVAVRTFAEEVFTEYQSWGRRAAPFVLSLPVMLFLAVCFGMLYRSARVLSTPLFQGLGARPLQVVLGRGAAAGAVVVLVGMVAAGAWSVINLARVPGGSERFVTAAKAIAPEWLNTVLLACTGGTLCAALSFGVAWLWQRSRHWRLLTGAMLLTLVSIPAPTLGLAVGGTFNRGGPAWMTAVLQPIADSMWICVLAVILRFLAVAALIVVPAVQRVTLQIDDAARADGADWMMRLTHIYWPQCRGNVLVAGLVVALLAVEELNCVHMAAPPGFGTLATRFAHFIHTGVGSEVAAVCLASLLTAAAPAVVLLMALRRRLN